MPPRAPLHSVAAISFFIMPTRPPMHSAAAVSFCYHAPTAAAALSSGCFFIFYYTPIMLPGCRCTTRRSFLFFYYAPIMPPRPAQHSAAAVSFFFIMPPSCPPGRCCTQRRPFLFFYAPPGHSGGRLLLPSPAAAALSGRHYQGMTRPADALVRAAAITRVLAGLLMPW